MALGVMNLRVVENLMKKTMIALLISTTAVVFTAEAVALDSLRGADIEKTSAKPTKRKLVEQAGGFERSFKEQPPMVPHVVDKYEVNLKNNGCLKCHSEATYEREKAPKTGDSHYVDRDGKTLKKISSRRYFCNQCHAPQLKGDPLVENVFEGRK